LKDLESRTATVPADHPVAVRDEAQALTAYRQFLATAPDSPQRAEAMRRVGDLEMARADRALEDMPPEGAGAVPPPVYAAAIAEYQRYLAAYPKDTRNDRVLYQLARAQDQGGSPDAALATLNRLIAEHPKTGALDEAQFRRGELLFARGRYADAEAAYAALLTPDHADHPYVDRALYMQGWARFKQGKLDEALQSYFGVLDHTMPQTDDGRPLAEQAALSRADRELLEDTFRVVSLSLQALDGAASIPAYTAGGRRQGYAFRVYDELGALYLKQERIKDAADTWAAFAQAQPLHDQAPALQARVIDTLQQHGFGSLAMEARQRYAVRYGIDSDYHRANPEARPARRATRTPMPRRPCTGTASCSPPSRTTPPHRTAASCWPNCSSSAGSTPKRPTTTSRSPTTRPARMRAKPPKPAMPACWRGPLWRRPPTPTAARRWRADACKAPSGSRTATRRTPARPPC